MNSVRNTMRWVLGLSIALVASGVPAHAQEVSPSDAQVLTPSQAAPSSAVCSDDMGNGVNVGVWRFGYTSGDAATRIKQLCDSLVTVGTPNANAEGLQLTECDVSMGDGEVFFHVTIGDDVSRAAASDTCLRLNNQNTPTHLFWGRGNE
jgi:hypothetical protein